MLRKLIWIVAVLLALVSITWFGGRAWLARSVARHDGTIDTDVTAPVSLTFDAKGVPQVWAKTDGDAYFAIGYLHASDRLFQMELVRRLAKGELSEVFGSAALETDQHQRRIGFARRARQEVATLTPQARAAMQRYVDGVNAGIATARMLPPEFVLLRFEPRAWQLEDCLAISAYQTWFSHELMDADRRYQELIRKLGAPAQALTRAGHPWSPPTVPDAFVEEVLGASKLRATAASNSWAVAPSRSASGAALHAADPHLAINQAPGLWYLAGLHSEEGLNVVGVTYGGAPFVVMGHNAEIAFSFTVASVDLIDYFDDTNVVRTIREEIRIKGEDQPHVLEVKETARGVMIDDKTSLRWAGFDFSAATIADGGLRLQKARNFDEFRRAVTSFGALDANWIYSDRAGNIGYQLGAPVPLRDYDTYVRQNANDPKTAWRGYLALDETPHALNPAQGFLASCNNQVVAPGKNEIPGFYDPYRITRAQAILSAPKKFTPDDMRAGQGDLVSGIALRWKALAGLSSWDGRMSPDSREAALFAAWWATMPRLIFEDELGRDWKPGRSLTEQAMTFRAPFIDDTRTKQVETLEMLSARAMTEAKRIANGRTWGEACTLTVYHPLARVKALDVFLRLNRGPVPSGGDPGTLDANFHSFHEETGTFRSNIGPSMRFVLDWSNVDSFTLTGALGQSGNPFSPHYDDFFAMQRRGEPWTVPFTRPKVFERAVSVLRLE